MEGGEEVLPSATATSAATGNPTASPPPLADLVGAPDLAAASDDVVTQPEIHALISDEEHDHEHEHDDDLEHEHEQHEHDHHHEDRDDHAAVAAVSLEDLKLKIIKQATPLLPFNYSQFNNCFVPAEFAFCDADLWNWRVRIVVISYSACRWIIELMCLLLGKKPRNLVFSRLLGFAAWIFYMLLLALLCGILVS